MSLFHKITERRYAQYPRRYTNEYHFDARTIKPAAKGRCATLASAKSHALRAIELYEVHTVRIFDHKTGQYLATYKASTAGILRHEGFVK